MGWFQVLLLAPTYLFLFPGIACIWNAKQNKIFSPQSGATESQLLRCFGSGGLKILPAALVCFALYEYSHNLRLQERLSHCPFSVSFHMTS